MTLPDLPVPDAVVYDLDGTLIGLRIGRNDTASGTTTVLRNAGVDVDLLDL